VACSTQYQLILVLILVCTLLSLEADRDDSEHADEDEEREPDEPHQYGKLAVENLLELLDVVVLELVLEVVEIILGGGTKRRDIGRGPSASDTESGPPGPIRRKIFMEDLQL
jgi:hypothetical protein